VLTSNGTGISYEKVRHLYVKVTVLVAPLLSESFCLRVVEAEMFGKSFIVTYVGSLPELVNELTELDWNWNGLELKLNWNWTELDCENGFVIAAGDVRGLTDRIHQIIIEAELRKKLGEHARKRSPELTVSATASNHLALINKAKRSRGTR